MKKVDYIVVGLGIAGISLCEQLEASGRSFIVIDAAMNTATRIAGGVVNPVVLKRINPVWKAELFYEYAKPFYLKLQQKLGKDLVQDIQIHRIFATAEEQNDWIVASDSPVLEPFLSPEIIRNNNPAIHTPFGLGAVSGSFRVDTDILLDSYRDHLLKRGELIRAKFKYEEIKHVEAGIEYDGFLARNIVFAEGAAALDNPLINTDLLIPKKGEYLIIHAPELRSGSILKGPFFIIPVGNDKYQVGATFAHGDHTFDLTSEGKQKIMKAIKKMISCDFEPVDQIAGMRPTVKDRRPLLGSWKDDRVYFFNGLGTRGLLMAPLLSEWLLSNMESGSSLPKEIDIKRFQS